MLELIKRNFKHLDTYGGIVL